eukprot:6730815-Prymnesium_polylepis.1
MHMYVGGRAIRRPAGSRTFCIATTIRLVSRSSHTFGGENREARARESRVSTVPVGGVGWRWVDGRHGKPRAL